MAALASDLEGNIVGGVALDLEGTGREVVEVLVEELDDAVWLDGKQCAERGQSFGRIDKYASLDNRSSSLFVL